MTIKGYNRIFWILFLLPFAVLIVLFSLISMGKLGFMPTFKDLENPEMNVASQIITEDAVLLDKLFLPANNRTNVKYKDLSPHLIHALIATEDIRFRRHSGIDPKGLFRALFYMGKRGGASTISQQLAKQLYHEPASNIAERIWQKLNEWVIAVKLEKKYTKEEIIALYLNIFDFNHLAIGIQSASEIYFNTSPDSLKIEEAATLVGMLQNPTLFNPVREKFYDTTVYRRNIVMSQMVKYKYLDKQLYDSISVLPIELTYKKVDHNTGVGTYFREYIKRLLGAGEPKRRNYYNYEMFKEDSLRWRYDPIYGWCKKNPKPDGTIYDIYRDGLKIYTTINYNMQVYAEEAVKEHLGGYLQDEFFTEKKGQSKAPFPRDIDEEIYNDEMWRYIRTSDRGKRLLNAGYKKKEILKKFKEPASMTVFSWSGDKDTVMTPFDSILYYKHFLRSGFVAIDQHTGKVKAYVGGPNFRYFKFDNATQGKRQAGSTFKPFLYILAMQEGYTPCTEVRVVPQTFKVLDSIWTPGSTVSQRDLGQLRTLEWGLAKSENYISAWLVKQFKPEPIARIAYRMGITSYIDPVPSMIYGTSSMSVMEMVGAYTTLANKGVHIDPYVITRIEDKNGNLLAEFSPSSNEAMSEETAFLMLKLMQGVTRWGTGIRLRTLYQFKADIAGKTGTTNHNTDGWFIGIAPKLTAGVWTGGDNGYFRFENNAIGQGARMSLPIWANFMQKVYADSTLNITEEDKFEDPYGFDINLDCDETNEVSADEFEQTDMPDF